MCACVCVCARGRAHAHPRETLTANLGRTGPKMRKKDLCNIKLNSYATVL